MDQTRSTADSLKEKLHFIADPKAAFKRSILRHMYLRENLFLFLVESGLTEKDAEAEIRELEDAKRDWDNDRALREDSL
jgi:hypothetical protein